MKIEKLSWTFFVCVLLVGLIGLGCEDKPDTESVDNFFDGPDITADTRGASASLKIYPTKDITLDATNNTVVALQVLGARGSVTWSVRDAGKGEIVTSNQATATYRRTSAGANVVIAADASGQTAFKEIEQP